MRGASGSGIRVIHDKHEALRLVWYAGPDERRRMVLSLAGVFGRDRGTVGKCGRCQSLRATQTWDQSPDDTVFTAFEKASPCQVATGATK